MSLSLSWAVCLPKSGAKAALAPVFPRSKGPGEGWPVPSLLTELQIQPSSTQGGGGRMGRVGNSISLATCISSAAQTTEDK